MAGPGGLPLQGMGSCSAARHAAIMRREQLHACAAAVAALGQEHGAKPHTPHPLSMQWMQASGTASLKLLCRTASVLAWSAPPLSGNATHGTLPLAMIPAHRHILPSFFV